MLETFVEIPPASYVLRVIRALGERGILARVRGVLMGRAKAWEFDKPQTTAKKAAYRAAQREVVVATVRRYNRQIPIVQNLDFGHTDPQIPMPYGGRARIDAHKREILASF
jgi:muramoyltetrapeptide carboxypeptidase LdcA involved in peptidoglycan recycling